MDTVTYQMISKKSNSRLQRELDADVLDRFRISIEAISERYYDSESNLFLAELNSLMHNLEHAANVLRKD